MGHYEPITVKSTVLRVDKYPHPVLMVTEDFVDFTNGRALSFPQGVMVVVGHSNTEGWGPDYYERTICVVPTSDWHPELNPGDGPGAIVGYYGTTPIKRDSFAPGDDTIKYYLKKEGRWPLDD